MKKILQTFKLWLLLAFISLSAFAQDAPTEGFVLKGKIIDEQTSEPLTGVIIGIKGSADGALTDENGEYVLKSKSKPPFILTVSYVGYVSKEIDVYEDEPEFNITLRTEGTASEIVVVGYGEQKRKDITGSVSSVPTELKSQPVASVERLLQGSVAGAVVTQTSGQPGGGVSVQIRGNNSITAGSDPL